MLLLSILSILLLLAAAALFSALETAITAAAPGKLLKTAENDKLLQKITKIIKIKGKIISTMLISYSIISTIATTIATGTLIEIYGHELGSIISSVTMAILIIVFAEVIPKAIAVSKAEEIVIKSSWLIIILLKILEPINIFLAWIVRLFCFICRIKLQNNMSAYEEVMNLIEYQHAEGKVFKSDKDMLGSIFDIQNITVSEIMVHRSQLKTINADLPIQDIITQSCNFPHSRIPLWKQNKDNVIGILHIKDLLRLLHKHNFDYDKISLNDILSPPWFIPENVLVSLQLHAFKVQRYHCALVVNEYGDMRGMVTLEDVLEEIVGRIEDEHDENENQIIKTNDDQYLIDGLTSIRDINRELNWSLPDDNASTIAGLIIYELKRIPEQGEVVELFNFRISITRKLANRIKSIIITVLSDISEDNQDNL
jgi:Mg2+/Co2+ transporter CorB